MSLEIIGSGFGRTGTSSLRTALNQLGFGPCHHMDEVFPHPAQVGHWQAVAAGKPVDWDAVFAGYRSQVDWPGAHVWRQLAAAYPKAKVIHTVRAEEGWWNSFSQTILKLLTGDRDRPMPPHIRDMLEAATEMVANQTFDGTPGDKTVALAKYRLRTQEVLAEFPPERLLVFDVAEGWGPLCRFLDVAEPKTPFPRLNSVGEFWKPIKN